jgi:hypothetical protein
MADDLWNARLSEYWEENTSRRMTRRSSLPRCGVGEADVVCQNSGNYEVLITLCRVPTVLFDLRDSCSPSASAILWLLWRLERTCGRWLGSHSIAALPSPTHDPYVCCPTCQRVHGCLRPTLAGLFRFVVVVAARRVGPCWKLLVPPASTWFVCTRRSFGCYRPDPLTWRTWKLRHVVLAGSGVRPHTVRQAVHQAMYDRAPQSRDNPGISFIGWTSAAATCPELLQRTLPCEQLGERHSLAKSLVLQSTRPRACIASSAYSWLLSETELLNAAQTGRVHGLAFVVDSTSRG